MTDKKPKTSKKTILLFIAAGSCVFTLLQSPDQGYAGSSSLYSASLTQSSSVSPERIENNILRVSDTRNDDNREELTEGAKNFIKNVSDRGLQFLADESLSFQERKRRFRELLIDSFDIRTIGRFVLGRYWRKATSEQRQEYLDLFQKMIIAVYSQRFDEYSGQELKIVSARPEGRRDVIVTTNIVSPEGPDVVVRWRIRYGDNTYKIIDVIIEGVSMLVTQRSDFAAVIQRGGGQVEVLLKHMRERVSGQPG